MTRTPAVIFDRDGTLASVAWCRPDDKSNDAWQRFNAALPFDAVVPTIAALLHAVRPGVTRIMTTGRTDNLRPQLSDWLVKHDLPIDRLLMRALGDRRVDSTVKQPDKTDPIDRPIPKVAGPQATVYECPNCSARYLGTRRCEDCNLFCRRIGPGGLCPNCDGPVAHKDLSD